MFTEIKILFFVAIILCLEVVIYIWSAWTATLKGSNFFFIERAFIFDKCARISGRVSAILNLIILLLIGCFGLKQIYLEKTKLDIFLILITLFAT
jgi:hypothetical protein